MFLGSYKTYFNGKNRLILPKKFRKELGNEEKFYVFLGQDGEIWGFDQENWRKQAENILTIPLSSDEGRAQRLKFFSRADECVLDGQGRFILPQEFIEQVNLKTEVLIIGAGDHFEIWDQKLWTAFKKSIE
jgi:MraZ protein